MAGPNYWTYGKIDPEEQQRYRAAAAALQPGNPSASTINMSPATLQRRMDLASARATPGPGTNIVLGSQGRNRRAGQSPPIPGEPPSPIPAQLAALGQWHAENQDLAARLFDPKRVLTEQETETAKADLSRLPQPVAAGGAGRFAPMEPGFPKPGAGRIAVAAPPLAPVQRVGALGAGVGAAGRTVPPLNVLGRAEPAPPPPPPSPIQALPQQKRVGAPQPGRPQQSFRGVYHPPTKKQQAQQQQRRQAGVGQGLEARQFRQGGSPTAVQWPRGAIGSRCSGPTSVG